MSTIGFFYLWLRWRFFDFVCAGDFNIPFSCILPLPWFSLLNGSCGSTPSPGPHLLCYSLFPNPYAIYLKCELNNHRLEFVLIFFSSIPFLIPKEFTLHRYCDSNEEISLEQICANILKYEIDLKYRWFDTEKLVLEL